METGGIRAAVREGYARIAKGEGSCCGQRASCCGDESALDDIGRQIGYSEDDLKGVPEGANLGLGCGNPLALASLSEGETVLDLGSGAGFDCFLAAERVGPAGRVIGVDMTPEMIDKARGNADKGGYDHVEFRLSADSFRPANLLQLLPVPGQGLRPKTTYAAIVLRSLGAAGTQWLGQNPTLTDLLAERVPSGPRGADLARAFRPLSRATLNDLGVHPQDIAAATVFTTGDPAASLIKQVAWANTQAAPQPSEPITQRDVYPDFSVVKSAWPAPQYQDGAVPFLFAGGRQVVDAQGMPVRQHDKRAPFQVSVPKGVMPAAGFPLYLYCHGTGGKENEAIDRGRMAVPNSTPPLGSGIASFVSPRGWGTACMAGEYSPSRIGFMAADGYLAYNFLNPVAMRDNFVQMTLEQVHFLNMLLALRLDPALFPGTDASASPDGKVGFDPDNVIVGGQSLGSYLAGMLGSTAGRFQGVILTGAGGSWVEFAFGPEVPFKLQTVIELLTLPIGERLDRFHPIIMGFDLAVGPADNTHYHRYMIREPLPGNLVPHVLTIEGYKDLQVSTDLQRALVLAIGLDHVGPDPGPTADEQLLPVLPIAGLDHLSYPVQGNRVTPAGTRTAVVVRYPEDGIREGHYVSFQLDAPKRQMGEFLDAIVAGTVPTVR